jgi:hypothetical protein
MFAQVKNPSPIWTTIQSLEPPWMDSAYNTKHVTGDDTTTDLAKAKDIQENLAKYDQLFGADEGVFV